MRLKKYRIIKTKKKTQTKTKGGIHANGIIFGNILNKLKNAVEYLVLLFGKIKEGLLFSIKILDPVEWITFFANYSKDIMNNPTTKLQFDAFFAELSTLYAKIQIKKYLEIIGNEFYNKFSLLLQFFGELKSTINVSDFFNKVYETIKFYVEKIKMILGLDVDAPKETISNYYQEVPNLKNLNIEKETFTEVLQELLEKQFQSMTEDEINNNEEWKTYEGSLSQSGGNNKNQMLSKLDIAKLLNIFKMNTSQLAELNAKNIKFKEIIEKIQTLSGFNLLLQYSKLIKLDVNGEKAKKIIEVLSSNKNMAIITGSLFAISYATSYLLKKPIKKVEEQFAEKNILTKKEVDKIENTINKEIKKIHSKKQNISKTKSSSSSKLEQ